MQKFRKQQSAIKSCAVVLAAMLLAGTIFANPADFLKETKDVKKMSLAGQWAVQLDPSDVGIGKKWFTQRFHDIVSLPGTLDTNQKGSPNTASAEFVPEMLKRLSRRYVYTGPAWYQKMIYIPEEWKDKKVLLTLERVLWESTVWIGDKCIGSDDSLVAPHVYDLSEFAVPGEHVLTVRIDNSYKYNVGSQHNYEYPIGHAYTDETQTIWNGIIGQIDLEAMDKVWIRDIQVYPDIRKNRVKVHILLANETDEAVQGRIALNAAGANPDTVDMLAAENVNFNFSGPEHVLIVDYSMGDKVRFWDEFFPVLYDLHVSCDAQTAQGKFADKKTITFGMREFSKDKTVLAINGRRVFLRGTLECGIFPLTGHPPTEIEDWMRIFRIARSYGLNHIRFHSWCPPKAAFTAADKAGFYLQVELPIWIANAGQDKTRDEFIRQEGYRILREYGNHPSFCLMSMGNELSGDFSFLYDLVRDFKEKDARHLYTTTSFSFQGEQGRWPAEVDDYFITQHTTKGWVRGQGFFNHTPPSTDYDFSESIQELPVPLIAHEIGQYTVYPNVGEIDKYTGALKPLNLMAIKQDLAAKGLLSQAADFTQATGSFAALLYKAEIELALRTTATSGFQMLDLHDYPGQGTAIVGILDAFWDSKGFIEPEKFRRFCSETVLLARIPKLIYCNSETLTAAVEIAHFGANPIKQARILWAVKDEKGKKLDNGLIATPEICVGNGIPLGDISVSLSSIRKASKLTLEIKIEGTDIANDWDIWVYPSELSAAASDDIIVSESIDEHVIAAIRDGGKILLLPRGSEFKDKIPGQFLPVFWSPVLFPNQPGTMGILCDPVHPALAHFPTESHSNWQWWELIGNSVVFKLDQMPSDVEPIVQIVDNFSRNSKLASIIEFRVGKARMILCSVNLVSNLDRRPQARQLRYSLLQYMQSDRFLPKGSMQLEQLTGLFREASVMTHAKIVRASSFQPGYPPQNAIDGDPETLWSTLWSPEIQRHPHEIVIDLGKEYDIRGFTCLPRQDGNPNGWIKEYAFYVSRDGKQWGKAVAKGEFERNADLKKVSLFSDQSVYEEMAKGRYIRLAAISGFSDDPYTTLAELDIVTD